MSDQGSGSRWSSAREREERERSRQAARERARRERAGRDAGEPPPDSPAPLTESERITIRKYQFPTSDERPPRQVTAPDPPPAEPGATAGGGGVGTRWRDSAPPPTDGPPSLPDLPGDGGGGRRRGGNNNGRAIIFGVALLATVVLLLVLPFGPFAEEERRTQPTPSSTLPSILDPDDGGGTTGSQQTPTPRPGDGQPIVCIDAGHGGWDTGWSRVDGEDALPIVTEAEMNLAMAWMLKTALEAEGIFVVMTRPGGAAVNMFDEDIDGDGVTRTETDNPRVGARDELQARINICNEAGADILISVHLNGYDDSSVRGYEILYTAERDFGQQNAELANLLYRQLDAALRETEMSGLGRAARPDSEIESVRTEFGAEQHMVMTGPAVTTPDYQIVPSAMPGVIVESAFLSNDLDAAWIVQPQNQQIVIDAYVRGILEYFARYPA